MAHPATVRIGTSGYSFQDWKGRFYPRDLAQRDMLAFYAQRFDTVELNFSYYRQPDPSQLEKMAAAAAATNPQFAFSVKAYKGLTHEITPSWREEADRFRDGVAPLHDQDRLYAALVQFPYSFHYTVQNRRHLDALVRALEGLPVACEFRSREWLNERVYHGLRARGVALVAVDEPRLRGLLPPVAVPTASLAYVRFHGRNQDNWWRGDSASRYDYLYAEDELREWLPRIAALTAAARSVVVYFNNHWRGQATQNAHDLQGLLPEPT